jgi:peptidyl-prolyl cis-trans isomerase SurA
VEDFEAAVLALSTDAPSRARHGDVGWFTLAQLPSVYTRAFERIEDGAISEPMCEDNTFALLMVAGKTDSRPLTLEDDWALLADKARDIYAQKRLLNLVKKWREEVFIDVRL